jgi:uncharacterized protein YukE
MGLEPRMRGRRFGRPGAKKKVAKERRGLQENSRFYVESSPVDLNQIRSVTVNSLEHLGNQRFALPPYSEHFQRWIKDVTTLLGDFEMKLPEPIEQQLKERIGKTLSEIEIALKELTATETDVSGRLSDTQQQMAACESEESRLESDYKTRTHQTRRRHEQSFERLRREIEALEQERLKRLHARPRFFQKIFHRSETNLEDKADSLRSKKTALADGRQALTRELELLRIEHETRRNELTEQLSILRAKLEESKKSKLDDALDIRKAACEQLRIEVDEAVDVVLKQQSSARP